MCFGGTCKLSDLEYKANGTKVRGLSAIWAT